MYRNAEIKLAINPLMPPKEARSEPVNSANSLVRPSAYQERMMKHASIYLALFIAVAVAASAQDDRLRFDGHREDVLREGAAVVTAELYRGTFSDVLASGVTPLLDEALETEGEVTDPEGNAAKARMTFVPFVTLATGKRGYFMRVSVSSLDGAPLFDHEYTVHNQECDCLAPEASIQSGSPLVQKSLASDVAKVASWIKARKWSSVQSWISSQVRKGVVRALIGEIVKRAFQKAGYRCPDLPWWIPGKFYIYLATCYRIAGG